VIDLLKDVDSFMILEVCISKFIFNSFLSFQFTCIVIYEILKVLINF